MIVIAILLLLSVSSSQNGEGSSDYDTKHGDHEKKGKSNYIKYFYI